MNGPPIGRNEPVVFADSGRWLAASRATALALAGVLVGLTPSFGQDDNEAIPGIVASYTSAGKSIARVEPDVAWEWKGDSPDPRLPKGPFTLRATGQLLIRARTRYRFHAFMQGRAAVTVDGREVLAGRRESPGWISGVAAPIGFGEKPLTIAYEAGAQGATFKLFWSSDQFPTEPLPAHQLFHAASAIPDAARLARVETGRREFDAHRCAACHRRAPFEPMPAPSLVHVADGLTRQQIEEKLGSGAARPAGERMPSFDFTAAEQRAIAAFLVQGARSVVLERTPPSKNAQKDVRIGRTHVFSLGCMACHTLQGRGSSGPYAGGDLSTVGSKRTADWLWTWMGNPDRLNANHRMPVFSLSKNERRQIVAFLSTLKSKNHPVANGPVASGPPTQDAGDALVRQGRGLAVRARCAACHQIGDLPDQVDRLPDLSRPPKDWTHSCLAPSTEPSRFRPSYAQADREALIAFIDAYAGPLVPIAATVQGAVLLEQKNCTSCHSRGSQRGLAGSAAEMARGDDALVGVAAALVPPDLTSVGDKLEDAALSAAVAGDVKNRRLTWLRVRMPRFGHTEAELKALVAALIGHDRIPDGAPDSVAARAARLEVEAEALLKPQQLLAAGPVLVGPKGFSCVACHEIGKTVPKNVSIPTHGSDLLKPDRRMRRDFFLRWTRSPLRIRPGMEMPSYERPVAGLLNDDVDLQLLALWNALNDSRFVPPTSPSAVEQFFVVKPGGPARIVRDVFESREGNGGPVARAMAIGFGNAHAVLLDLDRFSIRDWTVGDFARQRTLGKSWYWSLAGVPVAGSFASQPDVYLQMAGRDDATLIGPAQSFGNMGRLESYRRLRDGVELAYRLDFNVDGKPRALELRETIMPLAGDGPKSGGFRRQIGVRGPVEGHDVLLRMQEIRAGLEGTTIAPSGDAADVVSRTVASGAGPRTVRFVRAVPEKLAGVAAATIDYRSSLIPVRTSSPTVAETKLVPEIVDCVPGFDGVRLPLDRSIMPTAIAWTADGALAFTSLKGTVYIVRDSDGDGIEDRLDVFEEGLAAPYGIIGDGRDLLVAHKPEILRLRDTDGDGVADERTVVATGWGLTDNYHDWTCGIVRDASGFLYVGTGSDYVQKNRPADVSRWRGKVLRIDPHGEILPIAHALRYPTGLAIDGQGRLFCSDNQGDQNPFNEINHVVSGRHYGVPASHESQRDAPTTPPAIEIPHPWTRSVNGLCFIPSSAGHGPIAGHGIGCEYDTRFLIRFTVQEVDGTVQGAVFPLSLLPEDRPQVDGRRPAAARVGSAFQGPLCCAVSPKGDLYVGGIQDSGWMGGQNVGEIVRLRPSGQMRNGLRDIRATGDGFEVQFFAPIDRAQAERPSSFAISGYTRVWKGSYATPDTGRHRIAVRGARLSADGCTVALDTDRLHENCVYEVTYNSGDEAGAAQLWPATGYYTLHRIPRSRAGSASRN